MKIKDRIKLTRDVERFPDFIAWAGSTGTITWIAKDQVVAQMDEKIEGCEHWHNDIIWQDQYRSEFESDVELLEEEVKYPIEKFDLNK